MIVAGPSRVAGQTLVATVPTGSNPVAVAVNPFTNRIYVANQNSNNITVIDGWSNYTVTVAVGAAPAAIAMNVNTNKIYVVNENSNSVTVMDGATYATATVNVGSLPVAIAVNPNTNKIYTANFYSNDVTVIDGATNRTTEVTAGQRPCALAVDVVTNKIYVTNSISNTVTVIDGLSNLTSTVWVGSGPRAVAVDPSANRIYVVNYYSGSVSVVDGLTNGVTSVPVGTYPAAVVVDSIHSQVYIANNGSANATVLDGTTLNTTTVAVGSYPDAVDVNPATEQAYFTNMLWYGTVTVVDGGSDATTTVGAGVYPVAVAVNTATNRIYAVNSGNNTVSVIAGAQPLQFVPVKPCRVVDTRMSPGPFGGPSLAGGATRNFAISQGGCNIPSNAAAYSLNVTAVPVRGRPLGYLTIWPSGAEQPTVSTLNSPDGRVKANAAIVGAGANGAVSVYVTDATDLLLDIDGYFQIASEQSLQFYALPPCRVLDTREPPGELGGPTLLEGQERDFPVLSSDCLVPPNAAAYSMNFAVVPPRGNPLGFLTVWPAGQSQPVVSTLNNPTATVVANAAIVPAGNGGAIAVYPDRDTDLIADINGYFAAPGAGGTSLYSVFPCRVIDTRGAEGNFSGQRYPPVNVVQSACGIPITAQSYVFNATVVPTGPLGYLTLWADGQTLPVVSTLNAYDGVLTSNMAIVENLNGNVNAYAYGVTQLILDISSYFAP